MFRRVAASPIQGFLVVAAFAALCSLWLFFWRLKRAVSQSIFGETGKFVVEAALKTPISHSQKGGWQKDFYHFFMDRAGHSASN
jgi:hypothetical protein